MKYFLSKGLTIGFESRGNKSSVLFEATYVRVLIFLIVSHCI